MGIAENAPVGERTARVFRRVPELERRLFFSVADFASSSSQLRVSATGTFIFRRCRLQLGYAVLGSVMMRASSYWLPNLAK